MENQAVKTDIPHHDGSSLYVSDQAPAVGTQVRLRMRIPATYGSVDRVFVRSVRDGEPHFDEAHRIDAPDCLTGSAHSWHWWECVVLAVNPVLRYRFLIETNHLGRPAWEWLNAEGLFDRETPDFQDFRLIAHDPAPDWVRRAVIYQVFPDRFARSSAAATRHTPAWAVRCAWDEPVQPAGEATPRQLYGGDLDGVTEHLDHIQALGATVLYLTPFFPARSNHRYDATTFTKVDPLLGGDEALIRLVEAAHHRGLRVIGDLTANHSGDAHEWFTTALEDPHSAEAGFYYFNKDHTTYASWFGVPSLPKFNWNSPELRRRFITGASSVIGRWLAPPFNLDGWRIDVANMTGRHGADDMNHEIATMIRHTMQSIKPDSMLLAESTNDAAADFDGTTWHGAMTYSNLTRPLWQWLTKEEAPVNFFGTPIPGPNRISAKHFVLTHQTLAAAFPWRIRTQNMNALNSHDTARAATVMVPGGQLVGLAMIFTLPGIPTLFAGDEFGLEGINGEEARTPMPWGEPGKIRANLGPSIGELSRLRRELPALHQGNLRWLYAGDDVLIYVREHNEVCILVAASCAAFEAVELPASLIHPCAVHATPSPLWGCGALTARSTPQSTTFSGSGPSLQLWRLPGIKVPAGQTGSHMSRDTPKDDPTGATTSDLSWTDQAPRLQATQHH